VIKWFADNNLIPDLDNMKFITKNSSHATLHIGIKEEYIEERVNTKFLGLQPTNHPKWMNSIEQMIPKFSGICYAVKL